MRKAIRGAFTLPLCTLAAALAACGGGDGGDAGSTSASGNARPVVLSGWFTCGGAVSYLAVTPRANVYGTCDNKNLLSGRYSAQLDATAQATTPGWFNATLSNVQYFDMASGVPVVSEGSPASIPIDTYVGTGLFSPARTFVTLNETGSASKAGVLSNGSFIPTTLSISGPYCLTCLAGMPRLPTTAGGYAGSYGVVVSVPGSPRAWAWQSNVSLTIDTAGNMSGVLPQGTLRAANTGFDTASGIAEYSGTLTTTSGVVPVQGVFGLDPTGNDPRANHMVALYISGSSFQYVYHLSSTT